MITKSSRPDAIDYEILTQIASNARLTWAELAQHAGVTPPAAAERVRKMEKRGLIRGYVALLEASQLGLGLTAFIFVTIENEKARKPFVQAVTKSPEVLECHHTAGRNDYLLKVRCRDTAALEQLLTGRLKHTSGVRTETTVVLSTQKETVLPPIAASLPPGRRKRTEQG